MANVTGRPIAPARKLVAAVLGTIAVFVMVFGLGLSSWAIVALGAALLALAVALGMVNVVRRGARAWVAGQGQVKAVSDPPATAAYGRAELQIVVVAPGLPVQEVLVRDPRVPVGKWPLIGDTVPLTVDVDDMRRVRIDWDQAPDRGDDGDPPPPPSYEPADSYLEDDLLGEPEPPPWATRDRQWGGGADEPPPPPSADGDSLTNPIVVHDTPGGPVLEGQLVAPDEEAPLPKRARPARSDVLSDFPSAAAPSAAGDFAAAPPASAYPSAAEESAFAGRRRGAADYETAYAEPIHQADPAYAAPPADAPRRADSPPRADAESPADAPPRAGARSRADASAPADEGSAAGSSSSSASGQVDEAVAAGMPGQTRPPGSKPRPRPHRPAAPADAADGQGRTDGSGAPAAHPSDDPSDASAAADAPPQESSARTSAIPVAPDPEIDLPLDGDPEPHPEFSPGARPAVDSGIIAPPADEPPAAAQSSRPAQSDPPDPGRTPEPPAAARAGTGDGHPSGPGDPAGAHAISREDAATLTGPPAERTASSPPEPADAPARAPDPVDGSTGPRRPWADLEGSGYEPDERADDLITAYPSARPGPAGAIHGVGITVLVTDLDRSIAFYRDTLGFFEIDSGSGSAVLASGDTRLVLRTVHDLSSDVGHLIHLNLEVGDVEAVHEELKAKGVSFEHGPRPVNRGDKLELWAATFYDPDGHHIALTQWRAIR